MKRILIVEDDSQLNKGLCKALSEPDRKIYTCFSIKGARAQLDAVQIDLVLLDIGLPDGSGLNLLTELKAMNPELPVVLLTANDTDIEIVEGLESGADDYITKPFSLSVLRARINTQLKRNLKNRSNKKIYITDKYNFDFEAMKFCVNGEEVSLSKNEQKLLLILVSNKNITISREKLIDFIWTDEENFVYGNALSVTVKRIRDKLDTNEEIKTIYGIGYSWVEKDE